MATNGVAATNGHSHPSGRSILNRAEHVGSFLRTPAIHDARKRFNAGELSEAGLREVEDAEIAKLVEQQLDNQVLSVSDGEFRR